MSHCPFCKYVEDRDREIIIDETPNTLTILSNPALAKAHCLIVPKRHVENISELTDDEKKEIFNQLIKTQLLLLKKFRGVDICQNYRPFLSQSKLKVNHLHFHLIPRGFEDELYKKSQIYEKEIFTDLNKEELNEVKDFMPRILEKTTHFSVWMNPWTS